MSHVLTIIEHSRLSLQLFWRYGLLLTALWAGSAFLHQILLRLAVEIGMLNRFAGLVTLMPVVLLQLALYAGFFLILKGGLPKPTAKSDTTPEITVDEPAPSPPFATLLLLGLLPFYAYYAGWGLLGDTLRSYSQVFFSAQMRRVDFTQSELPPTALEIGQTGGVLIAVALVWLIRRFAKQRQKASERGIWSLTVVACEGTWALIGLYVIGNWKDGLFTWAAQMPAPSELLGWLISSAKAAVSPADSLPIDWPPAFDAWSFAVRLFWYALLPIIWFNLGAIIYGHDLAQMAQPTEKIAGRAVRKWQGLPKPIRDFIGHFWAGMVKRWHAVANGVLLAASAGTTLTVSVVVLWRLIDWLGNWAWIGLAQIIGPQEPLVWQVISVPLNMLFNAPGAPSGGLLVSPLQFCILAAGLQLALAARSAPPVSSSE